MRKVSNVLNLRVIWYSTLIWVTAFLVSSFIFLPWFYIVLPLLILLLTVYYFDTKDIGGSAAGFGLAVAIAWFFTIVLFSLLEIVGFYYFDFAYYFSDIRNWFLFPLVLLIPVVYGIILENRDTRNSRKKGGRRGQIKKSLVEDLIRKSALS
jgi:hypothetical protein